MPRGARGGAAEALALDVTDPGRRRAHRRASRASASAGSTSSSTTPAPRSWRALDEVPDEDWYAAWELNVMAPMRLMRAASRRWSSAAGAGSSTSASSAGKRPSGMMPEYSVAKAAELSLSRLFADRLRRATACSSTRSARARRSPSCGWSPGGLLDQSAELAGHARRERGARRGRRRAADRPARRGRRDRRRDRLPAARSAPPTSPARPGASTAARSR